MKQSYIQLSTSTSSPLSRAFHEEIMPGRVYESGSPAGIQYCGVQQSCHMRPCHCVAWPHSRSSGVCLVACWPTTRRHVAVLHGPACSPSRGSRPVARSLLGSCQARLHVLPVHDAPDGLRGQGAAQGPGKEALSSAHTQTRIYYGQASQGANNPSQANRAGVRTYV